MWDADSAEGWYALFVTSGCEQKVRKVLENTFGDQMTFIVLERELRERKAGKWHRIKRNLFPGYILLKGSITIETYYRMKEVASLSKLLKDENGPLKIDEKELEVLKLLIRDENGNIAVSTVYKENERVKVVDGPLVGLEGLIQSIDVRKGRAKVKIGFLGEPRIVQLGIDIIDKI